MTEIVSFKFLGQSTGVSLHRMKELIKKFPRRLRKKSQRRTARHLKDLYNKQLNKSRRALNRYERLKQKELETDNLPL